MKSPGRTLLCAALAMAALSSAEPHAARAETPRAVERAHGLSSWIAIRSDRAQGWLARARSTGKRPQARCLDSKLSELHALERSALHEVEAIERAARAGGLTGASMTRLRNMTTRSRRILADASACVQPRSVRVRVPTTYRVRVIVPAMHSVDR